MSNLAKLDFLALDITGNNYLSWVLDAEIHLNANNLGDTIKETDKATTQEKAKAMIFLRHHIHEALKNEYLTIKDPLVLWTKLKERITSQLILCGENITDKEMLEKTFSTFHASNMVLQQQYRERGYTKYSDLISCLLVAEQNNELLMKNHETRPVGTTPFPEANAATYKDQGGNRGRGRGHGYYRGRGHGRGHGRGRGYSRGNYHGVQFKNNRFHQKSNNNEKKANDERNKRKNGTPSNECNRCGMDNHWARTCRTPKHLVELYQRSIKDKGKRIETNFTYEDDNAYIHGGHKDLHGTTHMDASDFLTDTTTLNVDDFLVDTNPNVGGSGANTNKLDACNFSYA
ncbi:hypothetical protein SSX86_000981 [Deinandra increscens subsp. villosa]|uniref:CCHC-type domain-containing protein n=1 Tax=Deinandra increscens subsp. villosa TaxID=3103831 RepID=A0AAP0DTZ3_9ASTR